MFSQREAKKLDKWREGSVEGLELLEGSGLRDERPKGDDRREARDCGNKHEAHECAQEKQHGRRGDNADSRDGAIELHPLDNLQKEPSS
jgi:hypothetical protein